MWECFCETTREWCALAYICLPFIQNKILNILILYLPVNYLSRILLGLPQSDLADAN